MDGLLAIAIDPSYISKSGKENPHIGTFWSGCASSMKHGLEIMGLALVDVYANNYMMLRAHQTPSTGELKQRNMTLVQHFIAVIKRYKKDFSSRQRHQCLVRKCCVHIAILNFYKCRRIPNRKLISHTIKELFGWQRKAA